MTATITAWVARDEDGGLYVFCARPWKYLEMSVWQSDDVPNIELKPVLFPDVDWEDEEPTKVEIIVKLKG